MNECIEVKGLIKDTIAINSKSDLNNNCACFFFYGFNKKFRFILNLGDN